MYARKRKFCKGCKGKDAVLCARFIGRCTLICGGEMYAKAPNLSFIIFINFFLHFSPIANACKLEKTLKVASKEGMLRAKLRVYLTVHGDPRGEMYARNLRFVAL